MSALGDQLREFADVCDLHPEFVAFGAIVTAGSAINFSCHAPQDEREAFELIQRTLGQAHFPTQLDIEALERSLREEDA